MSIIYKGKLTKHFTIDEYTVNQTGNCQITREALKHFNILEEFQSFAADYVATIQGEYKTNQIIVNQTYSVY